MGSDRRQIRRHGGGRPLHCVDAASCAEFSAPTKRSPTVSDYPTNQAPHSKCTSQRERAQKRFRSSCRNVRICDLSSVSTRRSRAARRFPPCRWPRGLRCCALGRRDGLWKRGLELGRTCDTHVETHLRARRLILLFRLFCDPSDPIT